MSAFAALGAFEEVGDGLVEVDVFDGVAHEGGDGEDGEAVIDGVEARGGGDSVGDDDAFDWGIAGSFLTQRRRREHRGWRRRRFCRRRVP